jgi:hypothetical protein
METMNPPDTAPKDGTTFLANMGWPWLVVCMWNTAVDKWVYASPQINLYEGEWNDPYFESEWDDESELKGWIPMPRPPIINHF